MSSFVEEFKKYQKQERILTAAIVLVSVLAPVSFTALMNNKIHWVLPYVVAVAILSAALWLHFVRNNVSEKLLRKYETLDVGSVLAKKLTPKNPRRFVITNRGYNHFYLKCLNTGEQVLVSKDRVQEDFDIAN
ncbi:hypothetical protein [Bdellovibrio sp. BCCA]|uniref:hypothetical protein n=1 Tax=unclassified Bdellovibrio TaxID=2633795 RepID=UPI0025D942C3|nr:hypothetical protein [uncultured Bdellovibrio sp.]